MSCSASSQKMLLVERGTNDGALPWATRHPGHPARLQFRRWQVSRLSDFEALLHGLPAFPAFASGIGRPCLITVAGAAALWQASLARCIPFSPAFAGTNEFVVGPALDIVKRFNTSGRRKGQVRPFASQLRLIRIWLDFCELFSFTKFRPSTQEIA